MTITICGSISFINEMESLESKLKNLGFRHVLRPMSIDELEKETKDTEDSIQGSKRKIDLDLINKHWHKILKSDCILIANYEKKGIRGYVGGNSFLEMGFAFVTGKPIFILNPIPDMSYSSEIHAMKPIVINSDFNVISEYYKLQ